MSAREVMDVRTGSTGDGMGGRASLVAIFALAFVHSTYSLVASIQAVQIIGEGWDFLAINAGSVLLTCVCIWLLVKRRSEWVWVGLGYCITFVAQFAMMVTASDTLDSLTIARRIFIDMPRLELLRGSKAGFLRFVSAFYGLLPFSVGFIVYFAWQAMGRVVRRRKL